MVAEFIRSENTLTLATSEAGGEPRIAPLFYVPWADGLTVYWFSSRGSAHSRNLKRDPGAAVAIYRSTDRWREICGVQMRGKALAVADRAERKAVTTAYVERFRLGKVFDAALKRSRLYAFRPEWVRYLDNSRRFGFKFELSL